eukprot:6389503-Karenia_brevis.AAC.1
MLPPATMVVESHPNWLLCHRRLVVGRPLQLMTLPVGKCAGASNLPHQGCHPGHSLTVKGHRPPITKEAPPPHG